MSEDRTPQVVTPRRPASWRVRCLALGLSVLFALVVAEIGLRIAAIDAAAPYTPDEHCGSRLIANHRFRQFSEGSALITTNSAGHRDREHEQAKPPGVFRIAVLGDSFAEALQVDLDETFWSVLERELQDCAGLAGRKVEVLNFGVSGYGTTQELQMLRNYVWPYEPDLVLVAFLPSNDVRNNSRRLETEEPRRPFYELVDGQPRLDLSFRERLAGESAWIRFKTACVRHVRLLSLAYRAKENWEHRHVDAKPSVEAGLDDAVFAPPTEEAWTEAWNVTEAVFGEMAREVEQQGASLVVVAVNNSLQLDAESASATAVREHYDVADLDYPDRRLLEIGQRFGFPVILLTPPMREQFQRDGQHFHGFENTAIGQGHWNALGHRVAGGLMAEELCAMDSLWSTSVKP